MRINVIHFDYTSSFFGAEKLMYLYCQGLTELGHDVHLFSLTNIFGKRTDRGEQFDVETIPTAVPYFKTIPVLNTPNILLTKHSLSKTFRKENTIILADAIYAPPFLRDKKYVEQTIVPMYYWAASHPKNPKSDMSPLWTTYSHAIRQKNFNLILRNAKAFTAISNAVVTHLLCDYAVPKSKISLVHEAVDTFKYDPQKKSNNLRNKLLVNEEVAIMVTPHSRHNKLSLLRIMKLLKQKSEGRYKFILTGKMGSEEINDIITFAKKNDFYDNLILTGFVHEDILPELYASSDIFLNVGFNRGLTVLEAMASGLPIVSQDPIVSSDWIEHGRNGWIVKDQTGGKDMPENNEEEVCEFLSILIDDQSLRKEMSFWSHEIAKKKFDYKVISKNLEKVFQVVLDSNK